MTEPRRRVDAGRRDLVRTDGAGKAKRSYETTVADRLADRGFDRRTDGPDGYETTVFHRRKVSLSKMGYVDYFVVVARLQGPTPDAAESFSEAAFSYGLANKSWFPRVLGNALVVYPVVLCDGVGRDVLDWVGSYKNNHWGAYEYPAVVDPARGQVFHSDEKGLVGRVYYTGFANFVEETLEPPGDGTGWNREDTQPAQPPVREGDRDRGADAGGPTVKYCPSCGSEVDHDRNFCGACGTEL